MPVHVDDGRADVDGVVGSAGERPVDDGSSVDHGSRPTAGGCSPPPRYLRCRRRRRVRWIRRRVLRTEIGTLALHVLEAIAGALVESLVDVVYLARAQRRHEAQVSHVVLCHSSRSQHPPPPSSSSSPLLLLLHLLFFRCSRGRDEEVLTSYRSQKGLLFTV